MKDQQLIKLDMPELAVIEKSKAEQIRSTFAPMVAMLDDFEVSYNDILSISEKGITKEVTEKAKRLRIDIGRVRIGTEKIRKTQKEESLRAGQAIDGVSNILKWAVTDKEEKLKEIENHFIILEKKRLEELQLSRVEAISEYLEDAHERKLNDMTEDVWIAYLSAKKKEHEDKLEAEAKAEEDRIAKEKAEAEEKENLRKENEKLKKEKEVKEKAEAARKLKEKKEKEEREENYRILREEHEAELEKKRKENERIKKEEEAKRKKIEDELKAKKDAEKKEKEDEEKRIQDELAKGDKEKVVDLVNDLFNLGQKYKFDSKKNKELYLECNKLLDNAIGLFN